MLRSATMSCGRRSTSPRRVQHAGERDPTTTPTGNRRMSNTSGAYLFATDGLNSQHESFRKGAQLNAHSCAQRVPVRGAGTRPHLAELNDSHEFRESLEPTTVAFAEV